MLCTCAVCFFLASWPYQSWYVSQLGHSARLVQCSLSHHLARFSDTTDKFSTFPFHLPFKQPVLSSPSCNRKVLWCPFLYIVLLSFSIYLFFSFFVPWSQKHWDISNHLGIRKLTKPRSSSYSSMSICIFCYILVSYIVIVIDLQLLR